MAINGKRKFTAVLIGLGLFFLLMSFIIFFVIPMPSDSSILNALAVLAPAIAGSISTIIGVFMKFNIDEHKVNNDR